MFGRAHTRVFSVLYDAPPSKRFTFSDAFGAEGPIELSNEWARKCTHFFKIFIEQLCDPAIDFFRAEYAYNESLLFSAWVDAQTVASRRLQEEIDKLRSWVPTPR